MELKHEGIDLLSRYLQIDTSNPPGNEAAAVTFFAELFDREGIEYKIYASEANRSSIRSRSVDSESACPIALQASWARPNSGQ